VYYVNGNPSFKLRIIKYHFVSRRRWLNREKMKAGERELSPCAPVCVYVYGGIGGSGRRRA